MLKSGYILTTIALLTVPAHFSASAQTTGVSNPDAAPAQTTPPPTHYRQIGVFAPVVRPQPPVTPTPETTAAQAPIRSVAATPAPAPVAVVAANVPAARTEPIATVPDPRPVAKVATVAPAPAPQPVVAAVAEPTPVPAKYEPVAKLMPREQPVPAPTEEAKVVPIEPIAPVPDKSLVITDDVNSGIVSEIHAAANELPEGTLLRVRLDHEISTNITERGAKFEAVLTAPVELNGKIMVPAGSVLNGRVTGLRSGRHVGHNAAIHLQPDFIKFPDGSSYKLDAQVIDLFMVDHHTRVSSEGTILGNDKTPGTIAALGITTGAAALTGAALGGAVGAFVGAGIGAGASTMIWLRQESTQTLAPGTVVVFSLNNPMAL